MDAPLPFDSTLGAALIGCFVAAALYGVTTLQTFIYYTTYARDRLGLKLMVASLWTLDSLHMVLVVHGLYYYCISNFGNAAALLNPTWSLLAQTIVGSTSDLIVRIFFARRVWILSERKKPLVGFIVFMALFVYGAAMAYYILAVRLQTFANLSRISWLLYLAIVSAVVVDIIISVSLCTLLLRRRNGFSGTDTLLQNLVLYTINTGVLTSAFTIADFASYAASPHTLVFAAFDVNLSKLYINAFLASLNARRGIKRRFFSGDGQKGRADHSQKTLTRPPLLIESSSGGMTTTLTPSLGSPAARAPGGAGTGTGTGTGTETLASLALATNHDSDEDVLDLHKYARPRSPLRFASVPSEVELGADDDGAAAAAAAAAVMAEGRAFPLHSISFPRVLPAPGAVAPRHADVAATTAANANDVEGGRRRSTSRRPLFFGIGRRVSSEVGEP